MIVPSHDTETYVLSTYVLSQYVDFITTGTYRLQNTFQAALRYKLSKNFETLNKEFKELCPLFQRQKYFWFFYC